MKTLVKNLKTQELELKEKQYTDQPQKSKRGMSFEEFTFSNTLMMSSNTLQNAESSVA